MPASPNALQHEFDTLDKYLNAVAETLAAGHMPDMAGLDKRIAHLCQSIEQSEPEVQQDCLPKLNALLSKIDACEADIRAFHTAQTKGTS